MRNKKCLWFSSLWARLLFMLALIMLITQAISVLWLWHESQEQIVELVKLAQDPAYSDEELRGEERETIEALFIPTLLLGGLGLLAAGLAISWVTRPLARLAQEIPAAVAHAETLPDDARQAFSPMLAILSARHEHQYSRLFRS